MGDNLTIPLTFSIDVHGGLMLQIPWDHTEEVLAKAPPVGDRFSWDLVRGNFFIRNYDPAGKTITWLTREPETSGAKSVFPVTIMKAILGSEIVVDPSDDTDNFWPVTRIA